MFTYLKKERWSPYIVGILIALLAISSFFIFRKTIGISTTFVKLSALLLSIIDPSYVQANAYYQETLHNKAWIDWQFMLVIGVFLGAYISRKISNEKSKTDSKIPLLWELNFTGKPYKRYLAAFIGGVILMFGARFAGGCTSGHAISGGFQLASSGWLFMMGAFALGIPTALLIYRKKRKENL